jgi:aspartyl protease family protein
MRSQIIRVIAAAAATLLSNPASQADDLSDAKAVLEKAGLRTLSTGVVLANESELSKELGKSTLLRRNVNEAQRSLQAAEQQLTVSQRLLAQLKQQHMQLSAQLANIGRNDVTLNNRLVGALNATRDQYELGEEQQKQLEEQVKAARAKATEAREAYIQFVLNARKLADKIEEDYATKKSEPDVASALAAVNKATNKQFVLAPTATFQANVRRLKQLEDSVLSESIALRGDSRVLYVNTVMNGKYPQEMVLDSGASIVSLPYSVAVSAGLKPSEKDPRIILQLADGREIVGRQMTIPSLRVGKFTVENVTCAVLGEDAVAAEPLLGMSFLENFKFEIDASAKTLTMVKIAGTEPTPARTAK